MLVRPNEKNRFLLLHRNKLFAFYGRCLASHKHTVSNTLTMSSKNVIPARLFGSERWEQLEGRVIPAGGPKRGGSFLLNFPDFRPHGTGECTTPVETICKALSVMATPQIPVPTKNLKNEPLKKATRKHPSDALSVSTASTASVREEESDIDSDHEEEVPITTLPPDALFIIKDKEFPCHEKLLSKAAPPLFDLLSRNGVIERKSKRQRTSSAPEDENLSDNVAQPWSSPSGITVVRISDDGVHPDFFEALMEFLYTKEVRVKLPEDFDEDSQQEDPWLMGDEEIVDDDVGWEQEDNNDDQTNVLGDCEFKASVAPLQFLQGSFALADRFGCHSFKQAIEHKIYDELLFSFTAKELYAWANENKCAFLRQKASEKLLTTTC